MRTQKKCAVAGAKVLPERSTRDQLRLCWRLLRDGRVSSLRYGLPALVALYVLSPVDSIPDFLIGIGQMDDLGVAVAVVLVLARVMPALAPREVVAEHLRDMGLATDVQSDLQRVASLTRSSVFVDSREGWGLA
jgi:uncharacterized membrane protein YkvA (DUF1232 family)